MPAKDIFHETVKKALVKDGWVITADPLFIQSEDFDIYIDLGAEKIIAAEKNEQKIAVEIKSFAKPSLLYEFHLALGQFIDYREILTEVESEYTLYLAVPQPVYDTFFKRRLIQSIRKNYQLKLMAYDIDKEEIVKWQN
jgi:hypothetical protein